MNIIKYVRSKLKKNNELADKRKERAAYEQKQHFISSYADFENASHECVQKRYDAGANNLFNISNNSNSIGGGRSGDSVCCDD